MTESTSVICPVCHRTCGSGTGLSSHMRSMHREEWRRQQEQQIEPATPFRGARPAVPPPSPPSSNGIRWEEPPTRRAGTGGRLIDTLTPVVVELRRNPGKWARIREFGAKGSASASRKPIAAAFPDLELRAAATSTGSAIWARYVEPEG